MRKNINWKIEDYIDRLLPKNTNLSHLFHEKAFRSIKDEDVTHEMLKTSYINMAHIVKSYGDYYLPIFERLHQELEAYEKKDKMLNLAISISKKNPPNH